MRHLPTKIGVYGGMADLIGAALGVVTAIQGIVHRGSHSLLLWSAAAIAPALLLFFVFRPMIH